MAYDERHAHGDDRPAGHAQPPRESRSSISVVPARTSLAHVGRSSTELLIRVRRVPAQALFAGAGILAITGIITLAVALRSNEAIDALETADGAPVVTPGTTISNAPGPSGAVVPSPGRPLESASPQPSAPNETHKSDSSPSTNQDVAATAEPVAAEAVKASTTDLIAARAKGIPGLEQLAQRYPRDPTVLKALLSTYVRQGNHIAAMSAASRLLDSTPSIVTDTELRQSILMAANGPPSASAAAFDLMSAKMGNRGPDLMYELLIAPNIGKLPKEQAANLLRTEAVRKLATPALLIAFDLRMALPCARRALFDRARDEGDGRALAYLRPLTITTGCGFLRRGDCFSCIEPRKDLHAAITTIQKRTEGAKQPP